MANHNPSVDLTQEPNKGGRPKGVPNKVTTMLRETVNQIVSGQLEYVEEALDKVREKDPAKYLSLTTRLLELVMPKQSEVALTNTPTIDITGTLQHLSEVISQK